MKLYNDFIGEDISNTTVAFTGGEDEKSFKANKKKQPKDWYYRKAKIEYTFNSYGHRCKDVSELDFDNYVLYTGCSHTQGIGLELEKTYPYLIAQELGHDYYNLGIPATGIDVLEYNLLTWFFKFKKKPKAVVIQWPDHSRFISCYPGYSNLIPNGSWSKDKDSQKLLVNGENTGFFHARKHLCYELIHNVVDVPIIKFNYGGQVSYDKYELILKRLDYARDLSHSGIKSHQAFANTLCNLLR